jgi:hypothetical protein
VQLLVVCTPLAPGFEVFWSFKRPFKAGPGFCLDRITRWDPLLLLRALTLCCPHRKVDLEAGVVRGAGVQASPELPPWVSSSSKLLPLGASRTRQGTDRSRALVCAAGLALENSTES